MLSYSIPQRHSAGVGACLRSLEASPHPQAEKFYFPSKRKCMKAADLAKMTEIRRNQCGPQKCKQAGLSSSALRAQSLPSKYDKRSVPLISQHGMQGC